MSSTEENRQLMKRVFAEISAGDSRPFLALLAEDVRWTVKGQTRWSKTYHGRQAVLDDLLGVLRVRLADRYRATATRILADGDHVVVEARGQTTTTDGLPYNNEYCFIYRIEGGFIREVTEYLDTELVTSVLTPGF